MKTGSGLPANIQSGQPSWRRFFGWPGTRFGWWSVVLAEAFLILMVINSAVFMRLPEDVTWRGNLLPFYG